MAATPLVPAQAAEEPSRAAAQRKHVSILFTDLVGFTSVAEDRDPELVRETLTRYFETATTIVERYGGTIEKFIGDAVMAVWGTPVAYEDDAERAVRAALDLVDAVEALGGGNEAPALKLRAAVMSGEAAVTVGAHNQGLVAGDLVNAASRLQTLAAPGTVLVDDTTMQTASRAIVFEAAGERQLRGRARSVRTHRAMRVVGKRGGIGRSENLEPPFVGREAELRLVRELYHATASERRARLVTIVGQAGSGKSRLLWEFSKYTDGLAEDLFWHEGRSPAYGEGLTFWALGEMVRQRARLLEGEDADVTRTKLSQAVAEHVPRESERRWIEPALRQLLGVHEGRPLERDELFAAWRTFFERLAERDPTVLVFEDLQWSDSGLLDFIEYLLEWSRNLPIYIVVLARPELLERRPDWGAGQRSFTSLALEPLPREAMTQLLEGLVPGLPQRAVEAILDRAEGMPLYAVETIRMLLHQGRLEPRDDAYRPVGDLSRIDVPDSLLALISARLDALEAADRALLQDAAVLGQTFSVAGLAAVSGQSPEAMGPRLRSLVRREILRLEADPRSPERGQYGFVQALIREVAYGMLAKRDRRTRHLAAARFFEVMGDDELAGALAQHYLDAYEASPSGPEADAIRAQARVALRGAADRASSLGSYEQAMTYLAQARSVAGEPREEAELLERYGLAAEAAGHPDDAKAAFNDATDRFRALADRRAAARAVGELGRVLNNEGRVEASLQLLRQAADEFGDLADAPEGVMLRVRLASATSLSGHPLEAGRILEDALTQAEHLGLVPEVADGLVTRTAVLLSMARPREAMALLKGAQALAEANGLVSIDLRARNNIVFLEMSGDPRAGLAVARPALDLARRLGRRDWLFGILGNAAVCAFRTGEWGWVIDAVGDAMSLKPEGYNRIELRDLVVTVEALRGGRAEEELEDLGAMAVALGDPQLVATHGIAEAWAAIAAGRLAEAFERAIGAAEGTPFQVGIAAPVAARAARWLGDADRHARAARLLADSGAHGQAVDVDRLTLAAASAAFESSGEGPRLFREAAERWRQLGLEWDLALCHADYLMLFPGEPDAARVRAEALATFERLGATRIVHAVEQASRGRGVEGAAPAEGALTGMPAIG